MKITQDYIKIGNSRSGQKIDKVKFIVAHDTGNPGSTAYGNRNYFNKQQPNSSAHAFIDDEYILEIVPLDEKAWHVRYAVTKDDDLYGVNANDAAIGVELCWGDGIDFAKAYRNYVWYHAYLCDKFSLDPTKDIVAHATLDPSRRTDPVDCLKRHGISWDQFIKEVTNEMSQKVDGKATIKFEDKEIDGIIVAGTSYAPVRSTAEILGLKVGWDNENKIVTLEK